jgi:hypothetical protein
MSWKSIDTGFQIDRLGELNSVETFKLEVAPKLHLERVYGNLRAKALQSLSL